VEAAAALLNGLYSAPECALDEYAAKARKRYSSDDWRAVCDQLHQWGLEGRNGVALCALVGQLADRGKLSKGELAERFTTAARNRWLGELAAGNLLVIDPTGGVSATPRLAKSAAAARREQHPLVDLLDRAVREAARGVQGEK
jgi:hypothetical protein